MLLLRLPTPRKEFVEPLGWMLGDAFEDVGELGLGIDVVQFCCAYESVHDGGSVTTAIGAREQP